MGVRLSQNLADQPQPFLIAEAVNPEFLQRR